MKLKIAVVEVTIVINEETETEDSIRDKMGDELSEGYWGGEVASVRVLDEPENEEQRSQLESSISDVEKSYGQIAK